MACFGSSSFLFNILHVLIILISQFNSQNCGAPRRRKEIRELTNTELFRFLSAVKKLHPNNLKFTNYDSFANVHNSSNVYAHGTLGFLPWHRYFIRQMEIELQTIDPSVMLPYWDWSIDYLEPHKSIVLSSKYFGGNGDKDNNYCVTNGFFKDLQVNFPEKHCLRRNFNPDGTLGPFPPPELILRTLEHDKFDDFSERLEVIHNHVHNFLGNEIGDMFFNHSPNDPLFYMHHSFIDMIWESWQIKHSTNDQYEGTEIKTGVKVNKQDELIPFDVQVAETLYPNENPFFCYFYRPYTPKSGGLSQAIGSNSTTSRGKKTVFSMLRELPETFMAINGMNMERTRKILDDQNAFLRELNDDPDYIPIY